VLIVAHTTVNATCPVDAPGLQTKATKTTFTLPSVTGHSLVLLINKCNKPHPETCNYLQMNTCTGASLPKPTQNLCIVTTDFNLKYQITQLPPCTWDTTLHNCWLIATLRPKKSDFKAWSCNTPKQVQLTSLCFSAHKHYYTKSSTFHVWFCSLHMLHVWCRQYTAHTIQPVDNDLTGLWSNNFKTKMVWLNL